MFEAFAVGPFLLWTRVIFLVVGVWLSTEFFLRLSQSAHLSLQHFRDHSLRYLFSFLLCGRIFAVIAEYRVYLRDPFRILIVSDGGFSFLGAAIGIAIVLFIESRHHRATFLQWLDVLLPATTFGLVFDWMGKFVAGHAYGIPTSVPWAVTYDAINVRYTVPVHPVQLYYAIVFFFLTFILLVIRKRARRAGSETLCGILVAASATFFFDYFRGDFSIPVFATSLDFIVLFALFVSLGIFAIVELQLSSRGMLVYEGALLLIFGGYLIARNWISLPTNELRFSQFLAVLSALATVVYVVVHRRKYPHL